MQDRELVNGKSFQTADHALNAATLKATTL